MATVYVVSVCISRPPNPCLQYILSIRGLCTCVVSSAQVHSLPIVESFYLYICVYSLKSALTTQCCDSALQCTHAHAYTQLPSFPHVGLQTAKLLIGLVEELELVASPAPPDSQAPGHVFITKATYNSVLCNQRSFHQGPE